MSVCKSSTSAIQSLVNGDAKHESVTEANAWITCYSPFVPDGWQYPEMAHVTLDKSDDLIGEPVINTALVVKAGV